MTEEQLNEENNLLYSMIEEKAKELNKFFDSVLIIVTKHDEGHPTRRMNYYAGNLYSSLGAADSYIKQIKDGEITLDD